MRAPFDISLGVTVGVEQLKQKIVSFQTATSIDLSLIIEIDSRLLKAKILTQQSYLQIGEREVTESSVIIRCSKAGRVGIPLWSDEEKEKIPVGFPFRVSLKVTEKQVIAFCSQIQLSLKIEQLPKAKFVKNDQLQRAMAGPEDWGLLSMDSYGRMIVQPKKTTFPIIGIWSKTNAGATSKQILVKIGQYLFSKTANKCKFNYQQRNYMYMVRMGQKKYLPELYLVEWQLGNDIEHVIEVPLSQNSDKKIIIDTRSKKQDPNLQFTLRSDEKILKNFMDLDCSPIKFAKNHQLEQQLEQLSLKNSPRFKSQEGQGVLEQECVSLRKLVKMQQIEINNLKAQVLRLQNQVRFSSKYKYYLDSGKVLERSTISKDLNSSSGKAKKKLTESDLNADSLSTNRNEGSHSRGSYCAGPRGELEVPEADFWSCFELTES